MRFDTNSNRMSCKWDYVHLITINCNCGFLTQGQNYMRVNICPIMRVKISRPPQSLPGLWIRTGTPGPCRPLLPGRCWSLASPDVRLVWHSWVPTGADVVWPMVALVRLELQSTSVWMNKVELWPVSDATDWNRFCKANSLVSRWDNSPSNHTSWYKDQLRNSVR